MLCIYRTCCIYIECIYIEWQFPDESKYKTTLHSVRRMFRSIDIRGACLLRNLYVRYRLFARALAAILTAITASRFHSGRHSAAVFPPREQMIINIIGGILWERHRRLSSFLRSARAYVQGRMFRTNKYRVAEMRGHVSGPRVSIFLKIWECLLAG